MKNKIFRQKIAKGIVSLTIIVVLLLSVLAGSFYYQNNITANAIKEVSADFDKDISIKEIDAKNLNQLNEGWYKTINGNLFYLERFDKPVYLYARIDNPEYKNEIFSVDADGNLEFFGNNSLNNGNNKPKSTFNNRISGNAVGMESVSGMQSAAPPTKTPSQISWENIQAIGGLTRNSDGTYSKQGYPGKFNVKPDGSVYYDATGDNTRVRQTFTNGKWWSINGKEPNQIPITTQTPPSASPPDSRRLTAEDWRNLVNTVFAVHGVTPPVQAAVSSTWTVGKTVTLDDGEMLTATPQKNLWIDRIGFNYDSEGYRVNKEGKYLTSAGVVVTDKSLALRHPLANEIVQKITATTPVPAQPAPAAPAAPTTAGTPPGAPTAPAAPAAPTRVYTKPEDIPAGGNSYTKVGDSWYYKFSDGRIVKSVDGTKDNYEPYKITFTVSWTDAGGSHVTNVPAESKEKLLLDFQSTHPNTIPNIQPASSGVTPSSTLNPSQISQPRLDSLTNYYVVTVGNKDMSFNNPGDAQKYYNEQTAIAEVNKAWDDWVKQGNANTEENKAGFAQHLSTELKQSLNNKGLDPTPFANQVLQVKPTATNPQQTSSQTPYTKSQFPDGTWRYTYQGVNYDTTEDKVPSTLDLVLTFKEKYIDKGAQPVTNLKDSAGNQIYSFKGGYVSIASVDVKSGVREEDIGGVKYPVTYSLANGRMAAANIELENKQSTSITDLQLSQLRSYGKVSGNLIKNSEGRIQFSFTSPPKKLGDNEQTSTTNVEFFAKGPTETKTTQVKDKNNNILSLKETTNEYYEETTTKTGEKRYVFGLSSQKNYKLGEGETSINPDKSDYTQITTDPATGQPTKLTMREKGTGSSAEYVNGQVTGSGKAKDRLSTEISQYKSRQFFSGFQFIFTEFRGLGYIPSLFGFDDDKLIEWRNGVDKVFSTLYLGTEYWSSKICTATAGLANENEGIAYAETPQGMAQIGAHIEATRTQPIVTGNGTSYIYKITFQVRNGDYEKDPRAPENMSINVFIIPKDRDISNGIQIFKKNVNVGRGSSFGRFGNNAIVQESKSVYDKICIKFDKIPLKWKISDNILCNRIEDNTYAQPTALQQRNTAQQGTNTDMNNW